ncbi:MAG: signal peptidase I [Bifidobacteriaceae bacterium]|nr:signal peptidase I [Bifidobacteriaceae bacterium]
MFATAMVLALAALAVALAVVPRVVGGAALTVLTGSMQPAFAPGDMIVVKGVDNPEAEIAIGDVIAFMPNPDDPTLVTHRVIAKSISLAEGASYTTQGDANTAADSPILPKQIRGKLMYTVPYVGHATAWFASKTPWLATAAGLGLIAYGLFALVRGAKRRRREGVAPAAAQSLRFSASLQAPPAPDYSNARHAPGDRSLRLAAAGRWAPNGQVGQPGLAGQPVAYITEPPRFS